MKVVHLIITTGALIYLLHGVNAVTCPHDFVPLRSSCYHFSKKATTWTEAGKLCQRMGARLVSIESPEESVDINLHILYEFQNAAFWTSGTDLGSEGLFRWSSSGREFGFTLWCPQQPDNGNGKEHCVHIHHFNHHTCWNDISCNARTSEGIPMYYICEI